MQKKSLEQDKEKNTAPSHPTFQLGKQEDLPSWMFLHYICDLNERRSECPVSYL